ncbi:MAG: acetyl-CoA carboxylase carboxyltransferase subunit alpha [Verrucomicrobiota bacterium]|nr:acetyl-CoA carboxylase carboxyltransferase subunit alpha [Verrucomicrobiota bacterium]
MKVAPLEFEKPIIELEKKIDALIIQAKENNLDFSDEIKSLEGKIEDTKKEIYQNLTPWQRVQIARHNKRPYALDYIYSVLDGFVELHGDRLFGDDKAIVTGLATIDGQRVAVIGNQKGRDTKENVARNFGSAHPEGYRKALRVMRMAHKFGLPIITFIDTPGAYPGIGAEERHIAEAIAVNLREMALFKVPIIAVVIGEGGSGGALGIGVADKVLILENAYYSVISPEGCAAILWKHRKYAPQAAEALKMAAGDLMGLGLVDEVIPEPMGGAHQNPEESYVNVKKIILRNLRGLQKLSTKDLIEGRYQKYRSIGEFDE